MGTAVFPYQGQLRKLLPPRWVRLTSATTQAYISQGPSDPSTGLFAMQGDVPNGTYTLATGATQAGPWTTEDSSWLVASNPPSGSSTLALGAKLRDYGGEVYNVMHATIGLDNTNASDNQSKLQSVINAWAGGDTGQGRLYLMFPDGIYKFLSSIAPVHGLTLLGPGSSGYAGQAADRLPTLYGPFNGSVIDDTTGVSNVTIAGLEVQGNGSNSGSQGVHSVSAGGWAIMHSRFWNFGDSAIKIDAGTAGLYFDLWVDSSVLVTSGRVGYVGAVDISGTDHFGYGITATTSSSGYVDGNCVGIRWNVTAGCLSSSVGHLSQTGIVASGPTAASRVIGCRTDLNYGHGYVCLGGIDWVACFAYRNGQAADNTYDGFSINGGQQSFTLCRVDGLSGDANKQRHAFNDSTAVGSTDGTANKYAMNRSNNIRGLLYNFTAGGGQTPKQYIGGTQWDFAFGPGSLRLPSYSPAFASTFTPDVSFGMVAQMTLTGPVTVNGPTNGAAGQWLIFVWTQDGTGGRVVTYVAAYKTGNAAALGTTLSTKAIDLFWTPDGTTYYLMSRVSNL